MSQQLNCHMTQKLAITVSQISHSNHSSNGSGPSGIGFCHTINDTECVLLHGRIQSTRVLLRALKNSSIYQHNPYKTLPTTISDQHVRMMMMQEYMCPVLNRLRPQALVDIRPTKGCCYDPRNFHFSWPETQMKRWTSLFILFRKRMAISIQFLKIISFLHDMVVELVPKEWHKLQFARDAKLF